MKAIDSMWFNHRKGCFGLVIGEDETTGERSLYGGGVNGNDPAADLVEALTWGNKVNMTRLCALLSKLNDKQLELSPVERNQKEAP